MDERLLSPWSEALLLLLQRRFGLHDTDHKRLVERLLLARDQGHVCLPLDVPAAATLQATAQTSDWLGLAGEQAPVILDRNRLYLYRHHRDECIIAHALLEWQAQGAAWSADMLHWLPRLFPHHLPDQPEHGQWVATACSLLQPFTLISGGPGTGKTTTVVRLLALLKMQQPGLRVLLAAPTGKAAARLNEAMRKGVQRLAHEHPHLPAVTFDEARTLHRLLGAGNHGLRHHEHNPLHCDALILDEASMIDQYLMARVCQALPSRSRLILLGDAQQLAAVEAGSVLADIAALRQGTGYRASLVRQFAQAGLPVPPAAQHPPLADQVHRLQQSWRFGSDSPLGQLARAVLAGDAGTMETVLQQHGDTLRQLAETQLPRWVEQQYAPVLAARSPQQALERFTHARILAVQRGGPLGLQALSARVERLLGFAVDPGAPQPQHGLPFIIRRNDPELGLFNGDIGLFWQQGGHVLAWTDSGLSEHQGLHPARLPHWEPAWCMTVHQSQGSEFDHVLLTLPGMPSTLLSRELLYTAITRARQTVTFIGPSERLQESLLRKAARHSGLTERLSAGPVHSHSSK